MFRAALNQNIGRVEQISVDIVRDKLFIAVEDDFWLGIGRGTESDNHAMDVRLLSGFAVPNESSVREVDMISRVEKFFPKSGDSFALRNGICGYKSGASG